MINRKEFKKEMPHGMLSEVAVKAGVSKAAVTKYFNGNTKSSRKIERAVIECLTQYKTELNGLVENLSTI